jgi:hypothetical protein
MKKTILLLGAGAAWALASALSQPARAVRRPILAGSGADTRVVAIFERSCTNCHSSNTQWPLYGRIHPVSLILRNDIRTAKSHMDLSHWEAYGDSRKRQILSEIGSVVRNGSMPPRRYTLLHPQAKLSVDEANEIYQWTRSARRSLKEQSREWSMQHISDANPPVR